MKRLLMLLVVPSIAIGAYKVESRIKINDKTTTRVHQISEGDHVVYPCKGIILDATVKEVESKTAKNEYMVNLKVVRSNGATLGEQNKSAVLGKEISFSCPSDNVTAELTMKVTKLEQGASSQLEV